MKSSVSTTGGNNRNRIYSVPCVTKPMYQCDIICYNCCDYGKTIKIYFVKKITRSFVLCFTAYVT